MRRRSKSVGGSAKTRLRKTAKQKRRHGLIAGRRRIARTFRRETEIELPTRELNTIAEQQRATTEVLKLIGSSSTDPQLVFANILASAIRLCDANNGVAAGSGGRATQRPQSSSASRFTAGAFGFFSATTARVLAQKQKAMLAPTASVIIAVSHKVMARPMG